MGLIKTAERIADIIAKPVEKVLTPEVISRIQGRGPGHWEKFQKGVRDLDPQGYDDWEYERDIRPIPPTHR